MLINPPMLILDEATSSVDTRTEIKIKNAFLSMMKGRTSFKYVKLIPFSHSLGVRYDFTITAKSKTNPYPEKTVLNIDPL